ncbi:hypothetical protein Asulf_02151 [Archaeoglobus sulfaticallidus PM70-1]|uniref:HTH arsR-type domain-containing protein n=1 Tax=Archaeoglobus sulfaticallidus PM70-1 TaxID=387631 RepID=N0BNA0_9EURY|nr:helix-turn-helix domain-containing protein [Archaeoglobus sulfaticallidus]AGK62106.1 hypothetical protein Asulf_02151 [Archaeoglobus sulfaticallidus PM70-1]
MLRIRDIFTTSRSRILTKLEERPHTISELSKKTGYSKSTLAYHMEKLMEMGVVRRVEDGRKWVYYELTDEGRKLVRRDMIKMASLLVTGVMSIIFSAFRLLHRMQRPSAAPEMVTPVVREVEKVPTAVPAATPTPTPVPTPTPTPTPAPTPPPTSTPMPSPVKITPFVLSEKEVGYGLPYDPVAASFLLAGVLLILIFLYYRFKK